MLRAYWSRARYIYWEASYSLANNSRPSSLPSLSQPHIRPLLPCHRSFGLYNMPKRKRDSIDHASQAVTKRGSARKAKSASSMVDVDPDTNPEVKDAPGALRSSPDAQDRNGPFQDETASSKKRKQPTEAKQVKSLPKQDTDSLVLPGLAEGGTNVSSPVKVKAEKDTSTAVEDADPEADGQEDANPEELKEALSRPPAVNSSYLPLPWKGRLGYACLNTYLRAATPPVFSSRTCRIASILEHRHPLKDPTQPEHATKNRPDKDQPPDVARGQAYVEAIGLANARDIPKMLRWNERYGIKFMRLSSEMFPFASHDVYGYKLAPFASEALAEAGKVAAELGHRLTTHPGQFTQLGSPRPEVITASLRDLEYHCELLDLLKLPPQQDRDAVMILHMGGIFGDKQATIARFRDNYAKLPQGVKDRLVLENDDVCYSVHDLLPVCEELNIPFVLDYHHNNIVFDADNIREGTLDIMNLYDRIRATWTRKNITQKMHYSEPCPGAITARQRRKHNPRVYTLPPCAPDMDLMIEAKDKEQAVFEVMRILKLPGFDLFNDLLPYTRTDENKPWKPPKKKTPKKKKATKVEDEDEDEPEPEPQPPPHVPEEEIGMGGPERRVYWPLGMEEWLRPKKREVKPRDPEKAKTTAEKAAQKRAEKAAWQAAREASAGGGTDGATSASASEHGDMPKLEIDKTKSVYEKAKMSKAKPARAPPAKGKQQKRAAVPTPSTSDPEEEEEEVDDDDDEFDIPELTDAEEPPTKKAPRTKAAPTSRRQSSRGGPRRAVNYAEDEEDED